MGLGEYAAASARVAGLIFFGGSALVVLVILTLVMRSISGQWRSALPLWGLALAVLMLIGTAHFFSAGEVEKRRVGAIRHDVASRAGHLLGQGGWLYTQSQMRCPDGQTRAWMRQASGSLAVDDHAPAMEELARILTERGFAIIGRGVTPTPPDRPYLIGRAEEVGVIARIASESVGPDRLIIEAEAGCLEWFEYR